MIITFTKFYLSNYESEDGSTYRKLKLYNLYRNTQLLGNYYRDSKHQFFTIDKCKYRIQNVHRWYEKPNFSIIEENSKETIGDYLLTKNYNNTYHHSPDIPYSNPYLKISIKGAVYEFRRGKPEIENSLINKSTWGHYSFSLQDQQNRTIVDYKLKIENPLLDGSIAFNNNLEGTIETQENQIVLAMSGLFLLERFFDDQNRV